MYDFKVGDKVFWIETGYFEKLSCLEDIEIDFGEIIKVDNYLSEFNIDNGYEEFTACKQSLYFKSKNEAIDAMIKHLESMRDELRDDMMYLEGLIDALNDISKNEYSVLTEDICANYKHILKQIYPDYKDE